jgi:Ca2+-transporting ATPase
VAHATGVAEILKVYGADRQHGLSRQQIAERLEKYGPNQLDEAPPLAWWKRFLSQFNELVIWILIVAAVISGLMHEWGDSLAILAIVVLNGVLGFLQEEKAEHALASLEKLSTPMARVLRGGDVQAVEARQLTLGDLILVEAGDHVPADCRLIESFGLRVQEAALTGESMPADKQAPQVFSETTPLADRANMVYLGTTVAAGKATALVVATGMQTELGHIAGLLSRSVPEHTPLQRRLAELGKVLIVVCLAMVVIIFGLQVWRGGDPAKVFLLSVSLAVAAVPEGLPAVVTIALALGLERMVKRNALVRKLPSVETLGSVTVICTDKTGTLTRNEMTVREVATAGAWYDVSGSGYAPQGEFHARQVRSDEAIDGSQSGVAPAEADPSWPDLLQTLAVAEHCNTAEIRQRDDGSGQWQVVGDPTEGALIVAARKAGIRSNHRQQHVLHEIPFDSERKAMSVVLAEKDQATMYTKGAPEVIVAKCNRVLRHGKVEPLDSHARQQIRQCNADMTARALRVLALAYRDFAGPQEEFVERDLVFAGLAGMIDPPRDEVRDSVRKCKHAGIRPVMITGDHPATASSIARELEIAESPDAVLTGADLDKLDEAQLTEQVERTAVYARVAAEHKLRIVKAWKRRGQVVAMTGDGVNDAPAIKEADIGIAMGITGTDVTKEAADMVLTDDNFTSIVNAIEEGRGIFDNILKFVHYLLSCNASEVLLMFVAAVLGWPSPLVAIQILWINLVTDSLPALALGIEPPERDIMQRFPRPPQEPVITWRHGVQILYHGSLMAAAALIGFWLTYAGDPADEANLSAARTVSFAIAAASQLFFSLGCRSQERTLPELGLFSNPYLLGAIAVSGILQLVAVLVPAAQTVFQTATPTAGQWGIVLGLSLAPVTVLELTKLLLLPLRSHAKPRPPGAAAMR